MGTPINYEAEITPTSIPTPYEQAPRALRETVDMEFSAAYEPETIEKVRQRVDALPFIQVITFWRLKYLFSPNLRVYEKLGEVKGILYLSGFKPEGMDGLPEAEVTIRVEETSEK